MKKRLFAAMYLAAVSMVLAASVYKADFTKDFRTFRPHGGIAPKLENGKLLLETGTQATLKVPGEGRYVIKAKVSGSSQVQSVVFGKPRPTYSQKLEGAGEVVVGVYETSGCLSFDIYTVNKLPFVLEELSVESVELPAMEEADVAPRVLEAEDFPGVNGWTRNDSAASHGSYRAGRNWYRPVMGMPVPRTSKPLFLYIRARRTGSAPIKLVLQADRQPLVDIEVNSDDFAWCKMGPFKAKELLMTTLSMFIDAPAKIDVDIDRIAWSTDGNLSGEALDKVESEDPSKPLVSAFPVSDVKIDGLPEDMAWKNAMAITPFRLDGTGGFAQEQTSVKLGYDEDNLYVFFHAKESALDPTNQRMHEFINRMKVPDVKRCYREDAVFFLLQRKGETSMTEFVVNGAGVVTTATCIAPNYWGSRQQIDIPGIRAAAIVGNCFYNVEMAVPFASIGGKPRDNDDFRIILGRVENSRGETSAFSAVKPSLHYADNLIPVHFAKEPNGLEISAMPAFHSGINKMDVRGGDAVFMTVLKSSKGKELFVSGDGAFNISQNNEFQYCCGIYDPVTLAPLMVLNPLRTRVRSSLLEFRALPGVTVKVNGESASSGVPLSCGVNTIIVSGENAEKMKFKVGQNEIAVDSTWKQENGAYKRIILLEHSTLWPDWTKEGVTIMGGNLQQIMFPPIPPQNTTAPDLEFHVEIPENFIFEGASGYYKIHPLTVSQNGNVQRNGRKYNRFTIRLQNPQSWNERLPSHKYLFFVLRAPQTKSTLEDKFYFHTSSSSLGMIEIPNECKIRVIPGIQGKLPEKVHTQLWSWWLKQIDDQALKTKVFQAIKDFGYNEIQAKNDLGIAYYSAISFASWNLPLKSLLEEMPGCEQVNFTTGKKNPECVCTEVISSRKFSEWLAKELPAWYERNARPDIVCLDFEGSIFNSESSCACPKCLARFSKQYGLPENLSTVEIKEKYARQWCNFVTSNTAEIARQLNDGLKKNTPVRQFYVYSGYESENTKYNYGVDWKKIVPHIDYAGVGYGRPKKEVDATVKACKPKPVIMGVIAYPDTVASRMSPTYISAAELMSAVFDSNGGTLTYSFSTLDGRSFVPQAQVSRIIAENEEFFAPGEYSEARDAVNISGCAYFARADKKGNLLLVLVNPSRTKTACRFAFKRQGAVIDCMSGKPVQADAIDVPAEGIAVFRLNH